MNTTEHQNKPSQLWMARKSTEQDNAMWQEIAKHDESIWQWISDNDTRQPKTIQDNKEQHKTSRQIQDKTLGLLNICHLSL